MGSDEGKYSTDEGKYRFWQRKTQP